jgi:hypothetical protein
VVFGPARIGGADSGERGRPTCQSVIADGEARDRRPRVAHLVLPDEVQVVPSEQGAAQPSGRLTARQIVPEAEDLWRCAVASRARSPT